ncbi:MAG: hypothetical protein N2510_09880, partial [Ignavibacteria bacterium]|nr:hypothetical protein [Ignavibacteria bacterium]
MQENIIVKPSVLTQSKINYIHPAEVLDTLKKYMCVDGLDVVMDLQKSQGAYIVDSRNRKIYLDLFSFVASNP